MVSICWKISVFSQLIGLSLLLTPQAVAKPVHHHVAQATCGNLPSRQVGRAMFYGPGFDGHVMANGQIFDMNALTAASRTLPLGTRVRVTNTRTGRSAIVTITDRGSFHAKHVIADLSLGAAREIGLTEREGVAPVEIRPVGCTRMVAQASQGPIAERRAERASGQ
jgi:rare lipoprotein A